MRTRLMFALAALLTCLFLASNRAMAATPEDVAEAMRLMSEAEWHPRVSASKMYADGASQMVFVARDQRYTCYLSFGEGDALNPRPGFLSVFVRSNGTRGQDTAMNFADEGLDGEVDFGIRGSTTGTDEEGKYFCSGGSANGGLPATGVEHRAYWQALYDQAISEALRRLRHPGDRYFRGKVWHQELYGQAAIGARP